MPIRKPNLDFLGFGKRPHGSQAKRAPKRSAAPFKGFAAETPRAPGPAAFAPALFQGFKEPRRRRLTESMRDFLERRGITPAGGDAASGAAKPQRRSSLVAAMRVHLERQGLKANEPTVR